jgi:hypothetical protein
MGRIALLPHITLITEENRTMKLNKDLTLPIVNLRAG